MQTLHLNGPSEHHFSAIHHAWQLQCKKPTADQLFCCVGDLRTQLQQQLKIGYSRARLGKQSGKVSGSRFLTGSLSGSSDILHDMRYSCCGVTCLKKYSRRGRKLSISRCFVEDAFSERRKSLDTFAGLPWYCAFTSCLQLWCN